MMKFRCTTAKIVAGLIFTIGLLAPAVAQEYPAKPLRIIAPAAPGGAADLLARLFGNRLATLWKQPVVVENRAGAGGNIGSEHVARAAPDGYTLLLSWNGAIAINPTLYRKMPIDTVKDLAPVVRLVTFPYVIVAHSSVPVTTMNDLIKYAKANPGKLNYGTAGSGSGSHIVGEWFKTTYGVNLVHVPYKGSGPATQDLIAGTTQIAFETLGNVGVHLTSGKLKAIAVAGERQASFPSIPTTAEQGHPELKMGGWLGILAPPDTPAPVLRKLDEAFRAMLQMPDIVQTLRGLAYEPSYMNPQDFSVFIRDEIKTWAGPIKASGAVVD